MEITSIDTAFVELRLVDEEARLLAKACENAYSVIAGNQPESSIWPEEVADQEPLMQWMETARSALSCAALACLAMGVDAPMGKLNIEVVMARPMSVTAKEIILENEANAAKRKTEDDEWAKLAQHLRDQGTALSETARAHLVAALSAVIESTFWKEHPRQAASA